MPRYYLIPLLLVLCIGPAMAQSVPVDPRFGKVSNEECAMTVYPADTSAAALVLWEQHSVRIDYDLSAGTPRQWVNHAERIKILKDEAKGRADFSLLISSRVEDDEGYTNLNVVTYNLEKGKIVQTKMPKSNIFRTKYNDRYDKVSFAAQNVKVGSVVEVRFELSSNQFMDIADFYFQRDIPVNLSTFSITLPRWLFYSKVSRGHIFPEVKNREVTGENLGETMPTNVLDVVEYRAVDLPSLDKEPGVYCARQHRAAISYTVNGLHLGTIYRDFSSTWERVDDLVRKSDIMSKMKAACRFKEDVDAAIAGKDSKQDQLAAIITLVRSKVAWDRTVRLVPGGSQDPLRSRSGSNADINALVASAARYAGFEVAPVLLRRRSNGTLIDFHPSEDAFDKFILCFDLGDGKPLYVDAADPDGWFNVLNDDDLVSNARLIPEQGPGLWVDLTALSQNMRSYFVLANLAPDGTMTGDFSVTFSGCPSYEFKNESHRFEREEDAVESLEQKYAMEINDFSLTSVNEYGSQASMHFLFEKQCESSGEMIYVSPYLEEFHTDALFRAEDRELPVDFPYPERILYTFQLGVPAGYVVDQLPERKRLASNLPSSVSVIPSVDGSTVQISYRFERNTLIGLPQDYQDIREYWKALCSLYGQMIVLKKAP